MSEHALIRLVLRVARSLWAGRNSRWLPWVLALIMALLPFAFGKQFRAAPLNVVLYVEIYLILALGLNVVVGFTGLLDLGYVVFMATGAVITYLLATVQHTGAGLDWPNPTNNLGDQVAVRDLVFGFDGSILVILLLAGLACALLGVLRGIPTLRVRGDYFAIVTLGFAEIFFETSLWAENSLVNMTRFTGGAFGLPFIPTRIDRTTQELLDPGNHPRLFGEPAYWNTPGFYYLMLVGVILTFVVCHNLNRSRVGRSFAAIRLDETAARSCGVDVARTKLTAFAVSGFIGGVGGGLYAVWAGFVGVKSLDVWQSIIILCCIVLGGMGSIRGVALGTAVLMSLGEILREDIGGVKIPNQARFLIYGLLLIIVMRFRPQGILPPNRRERPLTAERVSDLSAGECDLYALRDEGDAA